MHLLLLNLLVAVATSTFASEHFIRKDGMPIIFGGSENADMTRSPNSLVLSPDSRRQTLPTQVVGAPKDHLPFSQEHGSQQPTLSFMAERFASFSTSLQTPSRCDPFSRPLVDDVFNGRAYHYSWCHDSGHLYTWENANYYCSLLGNGFQAVSIESELEQNFITSVLITHYVPDIWTSGSFISGLWSWLSDESSSYTNWSHTGRRNLPQPDNDDGNENCLAVFNNHYNDGVTWHDSNCHSLRPVICEARQFYSGTTF